MALPQLEHFMAIRGVSQDALMEHLGLTPQSWHSTRKAGGWFVSDVPQIAALLQVAPELLQATGVPAPAVGPTADALLRHPTMAALTDAALSDIRTRMQALIVDIATESAALIASGAVPLPTVTPAATARYAQALAVGAPGPVEAGTPRRARTRT